MVEAADVHPSLWTNRIVFYLMEISSQGLDPVLAQSAPFFGTEQSLRWSMAPMDDPASDSELCIAGHRHVYHPLVEEPSKPVSLRGQPWSNPKDGKKYVRSHGLLSLMTS